MQLAAFHRGFCPRVSSAGGGLSHSRWVGGTRWVCVRRGVEEWSEDREGWRSAFVNVKEIMNGDALISQHCIHLSLKRKCCL